MCVHVRSLRDNNLGAAGASAIAEALKVNAVLTTLDFSWNRLGSEGATAIAGALSSGMAVLKKLDVQDNNNLGGAGEQALRDAVKGRDGFELLL